MPELPDISLYIDALSRRVLNRRLVDIRLRSVFVLRSVEPPVNSLFGLRLTGFRRIGKRIVFAFEEDDPLFLVVHLMVSGRLHWSPDSTAGVPGKRGLCALDFENGTVLLTEAAPKKRAAMHVVAGEEALRAFDPGGLELGGAGLEGFRERIRLRNHTLKRALTDPTLLSGIGGAYADEILHAARLSPVRLTRTLVPAEIERLFEECRYVLGNWTRKLIAETGDEWPKVTAFRDGMSVHGRYGQPCPVCGHPVQRIVYADRETNYCPTCQNQGRILADRALSRLLKKDWPRTVEELEESRIT